MARPLKLDRLLSKLGIASRGTSQEWIRAGRVRLDGRVVREPATPVAWPAQRVTVDGQPVRDTAKRFFLFHKPAGLITTHSDERGRATIFDALPPELGYLHAVGRLDLATSGLLLLTNDTQLSNALADPASQVRRTYLVTVRGRFTAEAAARARAGVIDRGERLQCRAVRIQKASERESHLELVLTQGKNREIRRLCKVLGHEVSRLRRVQFGPFRLGDLAPGAWREIPIAQARRALRTC